MVLLRCEQVVDVHGFKAVLEYLGEGQTFMKVIIPLPGLGTWVKLFPGGQAIGCVGLAGDYIVVILQPSKVG